MRDIHRGNGVAIALAALAVVIAGSGTAVAVSSTTTISDPSVPSRVARVDANGRLTVADPVSTVDEVSIAYPNRTPYPVAVGRVTNATLALTSLTYDNSYNDELPNNDFSVLLVKITVGASGTCSDDDRVVTTLRRDGVRTGDSFTTSLTSPLVVAPTAGKNYCIGVDVRNVGTYANSSYPVSVTWSAYTVSGKYTVLNPTTADPAAAPAADPTPRPAR